MKLILTLYHGFVAREFTFFIYIDISLEFVISIVCVEKLLLREVNFDINRELTFNYYALEPAKLNRNRI